MYFHTFQPTIQHLASRATDDPAKEVLAYVLERGTLLQRKGALMELEELFCTHVLPKLTYFGDDDLDELPPDIVKVLFIEKMYRSRERTINATRMLLLLASYFSDDERDEALWDRTIDYVKALEIPAFPFEVLRFYRFFHSFQRKVSSYPLETFLAQFEVSRKIRMAHYIVVPSGEDESEEPEVGAVVTPAFGVTLSEEGEDLANLSLKVDNARRSLQATSFRQFADPSDKELVQVLDPHFIHSIGVGLATALGFERYDIFEENPEDGLLQSIILNKPRVDELSYWSHLDL